MGTRVRREKTFVHCCLLAEQRPGMIYFYGLSDDEKEQFYCFRYDFDAVFELTPNAPSHVVLEPNESNPDDLVIPFRARSRPSSKISLSIAF